MSALAPASSPNAVEQGRHVLAGLERARPHDVGTGQPVDLPEGRDVGPGHGRDADPVRDDPDALRVDALVDAVRRGHLRRDDHDVGLVAHHLQTAPEVAVPVRR